MSRTVNPVSVLAGVVSIILYASMAITTHAAQDPKRGDVRNVRVGSHVDELPLTGIVAHRCTRASTAAGDVLDGWSQYARCTARADGLHEVFFDFDDSKAQWAAVNDKWAGSKVAGHPVILSLLFDAQGTARALHIDTDDTAPAYLRKQAYLLRVRVWARYGRDGWACMEHRGVAGLAPIGGVLINEACVKPFGQRELTLTTRLYQSAEELTNSTRLEIRWLGE